MTNPSQIADQIEARLTAANEAIARAESLQAELSAAQARIRDLEAENERQRIINDSQTRELVALKTRFADIRAMFDRAVPPASLPAPEGEIGVSGGGPEGGNAVIAGFPQPETARAA